VKFRVRIDVCLVVVVLVTVVLWRRRQEENQGITGVRTGNAPSKKTVEMSLSHSEKIAGAIRAEVPSVSMAVLDSEKLENICAPLRLVRTHAKENLAQNHLGFYEENGARVYFNPGIVLLKAAGSSEISAVRTAEGSERAAALALRQRKDVEFAEFDTIQTRQFTPSDANLPFQWHHQVIQSFDAWEYGLGSHDVTVAIVDTPFQMNHPDLIENVGPGWDVSDELPILTSSGDAHSTASAGMAAATINNGLGVAGAANCRIIPIGINGATSEMYQAVVWAADHGVRVVNISWTGGADDVLEAAGKYLEDHAQGLLVMPGLNGVGRLNLVNQPHVICVSMTDAADNVRSLSGPHIDFAAPGWEIYSTTTNSSYANASGTSFAAPLFSGIAAMMLSINRALTAAQVIETLKSTADEKGNPGWDESYGWGRVNYRAAIVQTVKTLPRVLKLTYDPHGAEITAQTMFPTFLALERNDFLPGSKWLEVAQVNSTSNLTILTDQPVSRAVFYRVRAESAH
jgi:subtilisin family serine protease